MRGSAVHTSHDTPLFGESTCSPGGPESTGRHRRNRLLPEKHHTQLLSMRVLCGKAAYANPPKDPAAVLLPICFRAFPPSKNRLERNLHMNTDMKKYVESLLESYHKREREIAILRFELSAPAQITEQEMIDTMLFAHPDDSGHTEGHISDKTPYIALGHQERAAQLNAETIKERRSPRSCWSAFRRKPGWSIMSRCWSTGSNVCCARPTLSESRRKRWPRSWASRYARFRTSRRRPSGSLRRCTPFPKR